MKCSKCGAENSENASFCTLCWEKFEHREIPSNVGDKAAKPTAKTGFCRECGKDVCLKEDESCENGHPASAIGNIYEAQLPEKLKTKEWLMLILGIVITVGVAVSFVHYSQRVPQSKLPLTRAALESLKKVRGHTSVGVSYINYSPILADATYNVENFLKSSEADKVPPIIKDGVEEALLDYEMAGVVWDYKFSGDSVINFMPDSVFTRFMRSFVSRYKFDPKLHSKYGWWISGCISTIWNHASKNIEKADQAFKNLPP